MRFVVDWVLHADGAVAVQNIAEHLQQIVVAGADDHLLCCAVYAAGLIQILGNGLPQSVISLCGGVLVSRSGSYSLKRLFIGFAPGLKWKFVAGDVIDGEIHRE